MVGYEFEENAASIYDNTPSPTWYKRVFKEPFSQGYIIGSAIKKGFVRVPYLTKEQIEGEGWEQIGGGLSDNGLVATSGDRPLTREEEMTMKYGMGGVFGVWQKGTWRFTHYWQKEPSTIEMVREDGTIVYLGECKDINTFRYICKLLNIC
jgi:hypothetical protein